MVQCVVARLDADGFRDVAEGYVHTHTDLLCFACVPTIIIHKGLNLKLHYTIVPIVWLSFISTFPNRFQVC